MWNRVHHYITDIILRWSIKFEKRTNQNQPKNKQNPTPSIQNQKTTTYRATRRNMTALPSIFQSVPLHQKNKRDKLRPLVKEEEEMAWICSFHLKVQVNLQSWRFQLSAHFASLRLTAFALPKLPLLPLKAIISDFSLAKLSIPTCLWQGGREKKKEEFTPSLSQSHINYNYDTLRRGNEICLLNS